MVEPLPYKLISPGSVWPVVTWLPIESAPRDRTEIDLWIVPEPSHGHAHRQPSAYWCERDPLDPDNKSGCEGFWCPMYEKFGHEIGQVTHWMNVPGGPDYANERNTKIRAALTAEVKKIAVEMTACIPHLEAELALLSEREAAIKRTIRP